jgi:hypothetical protein
MGGRETLIDLWVEEVNRNFVKERTIFGAQCQRVWNLQLEGWVISEDGLFTEHCIRVSLDHGILNHLDFWRRYKIGDLKHLEFEMRAFFDRGESCAQEVRGSKTEVLG